MEGEMCFNSLDSRRAGGEGGPALPAGGYYQPRVNGHTHTLAHICFTIAYL